MGLAAPAVVAAACSSSGGAPAAESGGAGTTAATQQSAAATQAGSITYYTEFDPTTIGGIVAAFNKVYPKIKVNYVLLQPQQVLSRILTEQRAGVYNADIMDDTSVYGDQLINSGALQPYNFPTEQALPTGISLPAGYTGYMLANVEGIAYNPTALAAAHLTAPTSLQDFTKPEWRGKFSIDTGAVELYQSLITSMGHDQALNLIKALGNNDPVLVQSHSQALTQVESGSFTATATAFGGDGAPAERKTPAQIHFVMLNPAPTSLALIDLVKQAPHLAAARVFLDWYESQAGQRAMVSISGNISLRDDANNDTTIWDPQKWPPALASVTVTQDQYNTLLSEYRSALHLPG